MRPRCHGELATTVGTIALTLLALVLAPPRARAGNEDDFFVGDQAAMTAGAVTATVNDGSAAFYNPAGLAAAASDRLDVSAAAYVLRLYSVRSFLSIDQGPSTDASVSELVTLPTEIAYVRRLGERLTLGLGYFVPRATNALLSERLFADHGAGETSSWALDVRSTTSSYWLAAALGIQASRRLRLGFGLFGIYETAIESGSFFGAVARDGVTQRASELSTLGQTSGMGAAPGVGVQLDLGGGTQLGAAARGPQLRLLRTGSESISILRSSSSAAGEAELQAASEHLDTGDEDVGFVTLGRYSLGIAHQAGDATLSIELDFQPGLRSSRMDVDRVFTVNARAGISFELSTDVVLGAGIFSDRSTRPLSATSHADYYGATLGLALSDLLKLADDSRGDALVLGTVFAVRYAYGAGTIDTLVADPDAPGAPDLIGLGQSSQSNHEIGLHVGSSLRF